MNSGSRHGWMLCGGLALAAWVAAGAWLSGWVRQGDPPGPLAGAGIGQVLPSLALEGLDGTTLRPEDWRGRTVVLNVWATWCAPCREEMPALQRLAEALDPAHYLVVGVALDDDRNLVREFALQFGITFPLAVDPGGQNVEKPLGVWALPDTLIVTPQGLVADRVRGAVDWDSHSLRRRVYAAANEPGNGETVARIPPAQAP